MNNRKTIKFLIALFVLVIVLAVTANKAEAGGPWNNQYCDIETTQIRVIDSNGNVIEERVEEKVHCEDGVKDFLHGYGIADNCKMFTWMMPMGEKLIPQRAIACERIDGGYEIVKGYHNID